MAGSSRGARMYPAPVFAPDNGPGREIVYPGILRPKVVQYTSYDTTDKLQAEGEIVLACPADLVTNSAALHYVLREWGKEQVFSLRRREGEALMLTPAFTRIPSQTVHLFIVRANQRVPLLADDFLRCMEKLIQWLGDRGTPRMHFPILDPERPVYALANWYRVFMVLFAGTNLKVVLHNREYVYILAVNGGEYVICLPQQPLLTLIQLRNVV